MQRDDRIERAASLFWVWWWFTKEVFASIWNGMKGGDPW